MVDLVGGVVLRPSVEGAVVSSNGFSEARVSVEHLNV